MSQTLDDPLYLEQQILKFYEEEVAITKEQAIEIMSEPQRTTKWFNHRQNRITASIAGAAVGHTKKYASIEKTLYEKVMGNNTNDAMIYGTVMEDTARQNAALYIRTLLEDVEFVQNVILPLYGRTKLGPRVCEPSVNIVEIGLFVSPECPWIGVSSDGIVYMTLSDGTQCKFTMEIKCPWAQGKKTFYYDQVKTEHYDQMTVAMALLKIPAIYVQYTPNGIRVQWISFDESYWENDLKPGLKRFWYKLAETILRKRNNLPLNI